MTPIAMSIGIFVLTLITPDNKPVPVDLGNSSFQEQLEIQQKAEKEKRQKVWEEFLRTGINQDESTQPQ